MQPQLDTTQEITVPLDGALFQASVVLAQTVERLRHHINDVPAGAVHTALTETIIRVAANAEVLGDLAKEVGEFWEKTEVRA